MSLKGNLASVNLTEIFQMLSLSGREGTLFIYEGARKRAIGFTKDGVSIRSRERTEAGLIGKILVRLGKIDDADLQQAVEQRRASSHLLGDVLVDMGACNREDVELAFRIQGEEDIQELFLNRSDAQFEYVDGYFPETDFPYVNLNVNSLLIEIARRTDEWEYIRRRIRGPREIYRFTGAEGQMDADVLAECYAHRIDPIIDGTRSVDEIIDISYVNRFDVCKLLSQYLDAEVIELVPADAIRENARLALRMGDAESAIRHYEYLMSTGDFPLDVMSEAAEAHEAMRDFAEAAALLRRLAEELVRSGDDRGAIDSLRRVANYPRPEPEALTYLMDLVFKNPRAAAEFAGHVVEAGKTLVAYYLKHDQRPDALDLLQRLFETFPDEVAFAISIVNLHYEGENVEKAASECERMANAFLKRRKQSPAISLYKKLLIIDPERQDIREKIRKLVTGKKKRTSGAGSAFPRMAAAMAFSLLVGGAAIVVLKKESTPGGGGGGINRKMLDELVGGAVNELAQSNTHGERAIEKYLALMKRIVDLSLEEADEVTRDLEQAEENHRLFGEHAERAGQMAETLRTQTSDEEVKSRARSMMSTLKDRRSRIDSARGQWRAMAQSAAVKLYDAGRVDYKEGRLSAALKRFTLARTLASRRIWLAEVNLDQFISNIRSDVQNVTKRLRMARQREREAAWTAARRTYLELLKDFPNADLVREIRLPVEIATTPPGAEILLDGNSTGQKTPAFVRLDPFKRTLVGLKRHTFVEKTFPLGPFGVKTLPEKYRYQQSLLKAATWVRNIGDYVVSAPVVRGRRVAVARRNGKLFVFDSRSGKQLATVGADVLDTFDGVSAGLATDGQTFFVPTLDGKLFAFDAVTLKRRYRISGFGAGLYATPVVKDGVIFVVDHAGNVSARDLETRKRLWRQSTPHGVQAAPVVQGDDIVILAASGHVTVITRSTGKPVISYKLEGSFSNAPSRAGKDLLIFATETGHLYGVERVTGQVRWEHNLGAAPTGTGPIRGRGVFFSPKPKELVAIDFTTGDVIYHVTSGAAEGVANRDRIFFARGRTLSAFAPAKGAEGYALAWSFQAKGRILAGPVLDRRSGAVYIGDEKGNVYRLEASD